MVPGRVARSVKAKTVSTRPPRVRAETSSMTPSWSNSRLTTTAAPHNKSYCWWYGTSGAGKGYSTSRTNVTAAGRRRTDVPLNQRVTIGSDGQVGSGTFAPSPVPSPPLGRQFSFTRRAPTNEPRGSKVSPLPISVQRSPYAASSASRAVAPSGIGLAGMAGHPPTRPR
jgi:hypothetical protein